MAADNVNHPAHYETGKFECIDVMVEVFGTEKVAAFCECNAFKYLYRCENKHETPQEDWKKARWYLNKALELTEQETEEPEDEKAISNMFRNLSEAFRRLGEGVSCS